MPPPALSELCRSATLTLLTNLGAEIPADTRFADSILSERLSHAIDAVQQLDTHIPRLPLDVPPLQKWTPPASGEGLVKAIMRVSWGEMLKLQKGDTSVAQTPFYAMRQLMGSFVEAWSKTPSVQATVAQDEAQTSALAMKMLDVFQLEDGTPLMLVMYRPDVRGSLNERSSIWNWLQRQGPVQVTETELNVQALLARILEQNSTRLSSATVARAPRERFDDGFTLSFLLPIGPMPRKDLAQIALNNGCQVCGREGRQRCARCVSFYYCSRACQETDWPTHKKTCKTLTSATWTSFTMSTVGEAMAMHAGREGMYHMHINQHEIVGEQTVAEGSAPPALDEPSLALSGNKHGPKPFIVKLQRDADMCYVYDRFQTLQAYVMRRRNPATYEALVATCAARKVRTYAWAKRTEEERGLLLSLDQLPEQTFRW